jgi:predicted MFS family arabinose efflux permease
VLACLPLAFAAGAGWVWILTTLNVSMQLRSPEEILGRCLSIYQAVTFGGMALGAWTWGAVADAWGLGAALSLAGIYLVAAIPVLRMTAPIPPAPPASGQP